MPWISQGRDFVRVGKSASANLANWEQDKPEPDVLVPVGRVVPVAVRRTAVPGTIAKGTPAKHPIPALGTKP